MFKHFKNEAENQLDRKIMVIRSDRGGDVKNLLVIFVHNMV